MPLSMALSPGKLFRLATRRWYGPLAHVSRIAKVTVHDADFRPARVLASQPELAAFRDLWSDLIEADPGSWTYSAGQPCTRLMIEWLGWRGKMHSSTWFYLPGGTIRLLAVIRAIWVAPLYRTPSPAAFEALLRADPS